MNPEIDAATRARHERENPLVPEHDPDDWYEAQEHDDDDGE